MAYRERAKFRKLLCSLPLWLMAPISAFCADDVPKKKLLCIPEKMWSCNGVGNCQIDSRPETLASYRIDLKRKMYTRCRRDGSECGDSAPILINFSDGFAYVVFSSTELHSDTFRIELSLKGMPKNKFVVNRISGGMWDFDRRRADAREISVISSSGSCVVLE